METDQIHCRLTINLAHQTDLLGSLDEILLVDAQNVDPEQTVFSYVPNLLQGICGVCWYTDALFVQSDRCQLSTVSPAVGYRLIVRFARQA
jgi:hypothetical protein